MSIRSEAVRGNRANAGEDGSGGAFLTRGGRIAPILNPITSRIFSSNDPKDRTAIVAAAAALYPDRRLRRKIVPGVFARDRFGGDFGRFFAARKPRLTTARGLAAPLCWRTADRLI